MNGEGNRARGQLIVRRSGPDFEGRISTGNRGHGSDDNDHENEGENHEHAVNLSFILWNIVLTNDSRGTLRTSRTTYFNFFSPFFTLPEYLEE